MVGFWRSLEWDVGSRKSHGLKPPFPIQVLIFGGCRFYTYGPRKINRSNTKPKFTRGSFSDFLGELCMYKGFESFVTGGVSNRLSKIESRQAEAGNEWKNGWQVPLGKSHEYPICSHAYIYIHIYVYTCIYIYYHLFIYVVICLFIYIFICLFIYIYGSLKRYKSCSRTVVGWHLRGCYPRGYAESPHSELGQQPCVCDLGWNHGFLGRYSSSHLTLKWYPNSTAVNGVY